MQDTIQTHELPDGMMLVVEPFKAPNKNAACKVIAEVKSTRPGRRDVHFRVCDLGNVMTFSDMVILLNSLHALIDRTRDQMPKVQEKIARAAGASKPKRKSKKK